MFAFLKQPSLYIIIPANNWKMMSLLGEICSAFFNCYLLTNPPRNFMSRGISFNEYVAL